MELRLLEIRCSVAGIGNCDSTGNNKGGRAILADARCLSLSSSFFACACCVKESTV